MVEVAKWLNCLIVNGCADVEDDNFAIERFSNFPLNSAKTKLQTRDFPVND
jgi:hypothetical protein